MVSILDFHMTREHGKNICFQIERWFNIIFMFIDRPKDMREGRRKLGIGILLYIGIVSGWGSSAYSNEQKQHPDPKPESGKVFLYTAKKFGVPILKASIKIENGSSDQGKPLYQIYANIESFDYLKFLFRMNNRFHSTVEAETLFPLRYVKRINQEGLLAKKKNYLQTFIFDYPNKKVITEKQEGKERKEIPFSSEIYDPLSMFAKYYFKEELHPGKDVQMSIFDGVKLRQMVFSSKKGEVRSKIFGNVEAMCLESSTSFSSFEDREGIIRIWYTMDGKKIPILIELDLPIGNVQFELESVERS
jgi:hypothetical protein